MRNVFEDLQLQLIVSRFSSDYPDAYGGFNFVEDSCGALELACSISFESAHECMCLLCIYFR